MANKEEDIILDEIIDETHNARRGGGRSIGDHSSVASGLSDDGRSVSSQLSVWQQTKLILMGQNPNDVINEEGSDDNDDTNHNRSNGVPKSLSIMSNTPVDSNGIRKSSSHNNTINRNRQRSSCRQSKSDGSNYDDDDAYEVDFTQDPLSQMTFARRLALFLMKRYSWYNPALKKLRQQNYNNSTNNATTTQQHSDNNGQGSQLMNRYQKVNGGKYGTKSMDENDNDKNGTSLRAAFSTESGASFQILSSENKKEVLLNDAYPFTCSTPETPSLESAWAYFEHVALPRYIVERKESEQQEQGQQDTTNGTSAPTSTKKKKNILYRCIRKCFCKANKQLQRAEPGEKHFDTALYQPIFTPHKQLGDFGLGVGLYFSTLRAITVITFLAGILNIPNFMYFSSSQYNDPNSNPAAVGNFTQYARTLVKGSAICVDTSWVYCEDCANHTNILPKDRLMNARNTVTGEREIFALKNNCVGTTIEQAMISYATLLFLLLSTIALNVYLNRMEIAFDEDEQTAQDYSIMIDNPPEDATNPQEWHDFFKDSFGAHVTACTIAVDNDLLVRTLVSRRELLRRIELMVDPGTSLDTLTIARIAAQEERQRRVLARLMAMIVPSIPEFFSKLTVMNAKVQGLAQQHYPATKIFLTFETEKAQRDVLLAYNLGSIDIKRNNAAKLSNPEKQLFRGTLVLKVNEPDEPNTVRWKDLNEKFKERIKQQILTAVATFAAIVTIAFIVRIVNRNNLSASATAYTIAAFNVVFPMFAKFLTSMEAHASEGDIQRSLYFKIALFRWVNTAVVITIITPFTSTLSHDKLIPQIYALFFADITTTNVIQYLDPVGHIQRHILAPRAKTQDAMNLTFQGSVIELAERYTNMTKLLFLALWYCSIYPAALFLCSFALLVMYFMDRFSLMRSWKRPPQLGAQISQFSRRYFFSLAIVFMALVSSYYWASFPFDNLCETGVPVPTNATKGIWKFQNKTKSVDEIDLTTDDSTYKICVQDFLRIPAFPFVPRNQEPGAEWMTPDQEIITNIYGWSAIGVLFIVLVSIIASWYDNIMTMFRGTYSPCGADMGINFSDVPSMSAYVPQVSSTVFSYPLLAANIDNIDCELLEWTDPDRPHSYYDLTKDAEVLLRGKEFGDNAVFSQITHWPPAGKKKNGSKRSVAKNIATT